MSFKREGNDASLLKNLQHRRVSEILGDFIPDDEALLLSNGRLTCTICPKRPIFDTMQMLSLHRKGKNHLYELSWYLQHKRDLEYRKCKQIQKQFLQTGGLSAPMTSVDTASSLVCIARSLTPSTKKPGLTGKFSRERKFVLDMAGDDASSSKVKSGGGGAAVIVEQSANSQVRHYLKSLSRKRPLEKAVNRMRSGYGRASPCTREKTEEAAAAAAATATTAKTGAGGRTVDETELRMLESGWIRGRDGNWVKDPNVEFDTDEEEDEDGRLPDHRHSI